MNVLYISYDGMTDPLGQSQVIPYLCGLSKNGYKIDLVSCEKKDRYDKNKEYIQELLKSNNINWFPVPYSSLPSVFSKQLNLKAIQNKALEICNESRISIVHCRSYMAALIGLKLKKRFGIKFIFDMRGFWADERIDGGIWRKDNFIQNRLYKYFKKKEIEFLLNADYTISLTENAKAEILSWDSLKGKNIPVQVIPCCVDLNLFSASGVEESGISELRTKLGISKENWVLSYLGSIGTWYMLDEMLDFFKQLLIMKPDSKFLFITQDDKTVILSKAAAKGIPNSALIISAAERNDVPLFLSLSTAAIYFIKPLYSKKASSPTKTGEIMAMGLPLITNSGIGDSDEIIKRSEAGLLINEFTEEEYGRIIKQIDVFLKADHNKIKEAANQYFSLQHGIELYSLVYSQM